jgi:hypothetical protein
MEGAAVGNIVFDDRGSGLDSDCRLRVVATFDNDESSRISDAMAADK